MDLDQNKILEQVGNVMRQEGAKLKAAIHDTHDLTIKGDNGMDFATELDREVEKVLVDKLGQFVPEAGFIVEEHEGLNADGELKWIIDPIDGTKYFVCGMPFFAISVGLCRGDEPVLGAIYNPMSEQLYTGGAEAPMMRNGKEVTVNPTDDVMRSYISVDMSGRETESDEYHEWEQDVIRKIHKQTFRLRMLGSAALSLAWLASGGVVNAYMTVSPPTKIVDVAGGLALAVASGATHKEYQHPLVPEKKLMIVGREKIVDKLADIIL